jgi:putative tricarboxylic transport membrane protein
VSLSFLGSEFNSLKGEKDMENSIQKTPRAWMVLTIVAAVTLWLSQIVSAQEVKTLRILVPAAPGGGWDQTSRAMQTVLQEQKIVGTVEVFNVAGAGGTVGLARLASTEKGKGDILMTMGAVMVGAILANKSPVGLGQTTPIARLTAEYEVVAVPASSPHKTMADLLKVLKADPGSVSWAGGSAGGIDHILVGLIGKEQGITATRLNYVPFSGGGEALASILGGHVTAGVSGYGEWLPQIQVGQLRVLAISSEQRIPGVDLPTLREQGINIALANWRGVVAPGGVSEGDKKALVATMEKVAKSDAWKKILQTRSWNDYFLAGDPFAKFITAENTRIQTILNEIGLTKK